MLIYSCFTLCLFGVQSVESQAPYVTSKRSYFNEPSWNYEAYNGPNFWYKNYPQCGGYSQSPVALPDKPDHVKTVPRGENNYNVPHDMDIVNTGNFIQLQINDDDSQPIPDSAYVDTKERYSLFKIIMHWGEDLLRGSEHSIGGLTYPIENQYLFYDRKYKSPAEAAKHPDGQLMNVAFVQAGEPAPIVDKLINVISSLNGSTDAVNCKWVPRFLQWELFRESDFYSYKGSLTYPPCNQISRVNVFTGIRDIYSVEQIRTLASIVSPSGKLLATNTRPIQPYNKRKITLVRRESTPANTKRKLNRQPGRSFRRTGNQLDNFHGRRDFDLDEFDQHNRWDRYDSLDQHNSWERSDSLDQHNSWDGPRYRDADFPRNFVDRVNEFDRRHGPLDTDYDDRSWDVPRDHVTDGYSRH